MIESNKERLVKMKKNGFTLIELIVALALGGFLSLIALWSFSSYLAKAQAREAMVLLSTERMKIERALTHGACTMSGNVENYKGKYGVLTISGTFKPAQGDSCPTGCLLEYAFNSSGVHKLIANKVVSADVLNSLKLSKNLTKTTLDSKFLPINFIKVNTEVGESCAVLGNTEPTPTNGSGTTGTETGVVSGGVLPGGTGTGGTGTDGTGTDGTGTGGTGTGGTGTGGTGTGAVVGDGAATITGLSFWNSVAGGTLIPPTHNGSMSFPTTRKYLRFTVTSAEPGAKIKIYCSGWNPWPTNLQGSTCFYSATSIGSAVANATRINAKGFLNSGVLVTEPNVTGLVLTYPNGISKSEDVAIELSAMFGAFEEMNSQVNTVVYNKGKLLGQTAVYFREY